ncbi:MULTISPECIES: TolB-like translocation protein [unclassified Streptomyces]|uniref:TolB family protein n=1 Tax=unclassified Streptomyces TaxID=2593676 RepID=UPI0033F2F1BF
MTLRHKLIVLVTALVVLAGVATASVRHAVGREDRRNQVQAGGPTVRGGEVSLAPGAGRRIVFRTMAWGPHRDELATVPAAAPAGPRTASGVKCLRFHAAGGTGVCLQAERGAVRDGYRAVVLDAELKERARYGLPGIPTRARVSPSGHLAAWTVFVGGDSYAGTNFSTRTAILDTRTGTLSRTLEDFAIERDGHPYRASDVNFWGVTFADDTRFYATMATAGKTYLVRGDLPSRRVTTLRTNVECPSLSPDGTRLAFKKRVPGLPADAPWHLYVLDLATMRETPLAEPRSVDDQLVWQDDRTVTYALPGDYGADLYTLPANGTGSPHRLLTAGLAPVFLG